ncbi:cyclic nucleotide-binding domain-containing protein [Rhodoplanes serenus]|jgi:voltage-gated potassium channel|uniref:Cyclic nucleotide-binding domain-containing protein n=1 Tax=Rhodoplanes serenus TaxID=200615 RepID=A0A327KFR2_9BRAD|nr:cyclic nucleotide-gated ion channel [Rhodoplanes serenus]MBI5113126.1 ion transporter [Rhodovulum sp.]MTW15227.1 cyclic nucleotide-binding domain-containing protein [Rhodoplanes serenus]RAI37187.1 cyclic nucleotide-binding protein [Rhodoplanes serenus]VCU10900.1 Cyclic nucleotide-gated potassium channel [Rhodoplanes serenus]
MRGHDKRTIEKRTGDLRRRVHDVLEHGTGSDRTSLAVDRALVVLIMLNLVGVVLESVPEIDAVWHSAFVAIEIVSLVVFSVEYGLRVWSAPENPPWRSLSPGQARRRYVTSPVGIIDLLAILPFWFIFAVPEDLRIVLVFRVVRFLKLTRYSPGMRSLLDALYNERRALLGCLVIFFGATLFAATLMYLAERHVQPDKLGTIPDAIWWAFVTLGTIGYGDVVPVTALGKTIAAATILTAMAMVALPVGIIATAFADEIHRRDFVVTWGMVARVPLFAGLDAAAIADILRHLKAQTVDAGDVIVRVGDPAHSMYFIARGAVDIDLRGRHITLGVGHFFGEIAVLRRARRSATVTALTRANLLVLDGNDLHRLMERDPRIAARIDEVVRERIGSDLVSRRGDMVTEEIAQGQEHGPQP